MITSVDDWLLFLKGSETAVAFPLIVGGLALMLFGWRMWRLSVMLTFGVMGAWLAATWAGPGDDQVLYALAGGVALALLGGSPVKYCVSLLGGVVGALVFAGVLSGMGLGGPALWMGAAVGLVGCACVAFIHRNPCVIAVTAFLGAALMVSGLAVLVMRMPTLYGAFHALGTGNTVVLPFLLFVPTVVSCFYQAGEVRRSHSAE